MSSEAKDLLHDPTDAASERFLCNICEAPVTSVMNDIGLESVDIVIVGGGPHALAALSALRDGSLDEEGQGSPDGSDSSCTLGTGLRALPLLLSNKTCVCRACWICHDALTNMNAIMCAVVPSSRSMRTRPWLALYGLLEQTDRCPGNPAPSFARPRPPCGLRTRSAPRIRHARGQDL